MNFNKVQQNDKITKTVNLLIEDFKNVKVQELKSSSGYISAKVVESNKQPGTDGKIPIEVSLLPGFPPGRITAKITAISNIDSLPAATLHIAGVITGDIEVAPETFYIHVKKRANKNIAPASKKIVIINHSETRKLGIEGIQDERNILEIDLNTVQEGKRYEIMAGLLDVESIKANVRGTIVVSTSFPDQKQIKIPYTITMQR